MNSTMQRQQAWMRYQQTGNQEDYQEYLRLDTLAKAERKAENERWLQQTSQTSRQEMFKGVKCGRL
jgi:hypothetical protein